MSEREGLLSSSSAPTTAVGTPDSAGPTPPTAAAATVAAAASALLPAPPRDEELQRFVDAVVSGRAPLAHSVDPCEVTGTRTRLGAGASGAVFKALYRGREVAVKWFSENNLAFDEGEVKCEAALMSVLEHPNLATYVGACLRPGAMFIITELYPANLQAVIDNRAIELPLAAVLRVSMGIANGMRFLHSLGLVHRDLKSANVLLTHDLDAKITDFGTTRVVPRNGRQLMTGGIGTLEWMAPEVMAHELYSSKADVYSFSICLWQMLARTDPFPGISQFAIPEQVLRGVRPSLPPNCPQKLSLLIRACWHQKPRYRPEFAEILRFLQVIAGLSPAAFETTTEFFRKNAITLPKNAPISRITEMQAGAVLLKCGRSGRPHFSLFQLSDDLTHIQWTSRRKDPASTRIRIDQIKELCLGQLTAVFARSNLANYRNISFSAVCESRTLDVVCTNATEFKTWTSGLKALIPRGTRVRTSSLSGSSPPPVLPPPADDGARAGTSADSATSPPSPYTASPTDAPLAPKPDYPAPTPSAAASSSATAAVAASTTTAGAAILHAHFFDDTEPMRAGRRRSMSVGSQPVHPTMLGIMSRGLFLCGAGSETSVTRKEICKDAYLWPVGRHAPRVPTISPVLIEQLLGKDVTMLSCGETHYAALTANGELFMWGNNTFGQLGQFFCKPGAVLDEESLSVPRIVPFAGVRLRSVSCGKHHTLCLTVDGAVFAWGKNKYGQLGLGDTQQRSTPTRLPVFNHSAAVLVACGPHTSAAYTETCDAYMWGLNDCCQLGLGHNHSVNSPQLLTAPFSKSTASSALAVAAASSSIPETPSSLPRLTLRGAKRPVLALVGVADPIPSPASVAFSPSMWDSPPPPPPAVESAPSPSPLPQVVESISLGLFISAALTTSGAVWLWGKIGDKIDATPKLTKFGGALAAIQVSCGSQHVAVLADDGQLYTWGDGHLGQLGRGPEEFSALPQAVLGPFSKHKPEKVCCSSTYTAVITSDGSIYAFGVGSSGKGSVREESVPRLLSAFKHKHAVELSCGPRAIVALVTQRRTPDERLSGWVPDKEAPRCMACKESFTTLRRRHHCRRCEGVFCGACSRWRSPLLSKGFSEPVRVCFRCFSLLAAASARRSHDSIATPQTSATASDRNPSGDA